MSSSGPAHYRLISTIKSKPLSFTIVTIDGTTMLLFELPADILIALICISELKDVLRLEQVDTSPIWESSYTLTFV